MLVKHCYEDGAHVLNYYGESEGVYILSTHLIKILLVSDIDECLQANSCKGICHNTNGSFRCTECPLETEYDPLKMQCAKIKQQPLLLGKTIFIVTFMIDRIEQKLKRD